MGKHADKQEVRTYFQMFLGEFEISVFDVMKLNKELSKHPYNKKKYVLIGNKLYLNNLR